MSLSIRPWSRVWIAALLLAAGSPQLAAQLPAPQVVATRPLHLGAYGAITFVRGDATDRDGDLDLNDAVAALLAFGSIASRLSYFAELEVASTSYETWTGHREERELELERAYLELAPAAALRARVGRFLTPVGQWNELHAAPLTWSAVRPLTTYRPFPKSVTGVALAGAAALGGRDVGWVLYYTPPGIDEQDGEESALRSGGGARAAIELKPGVTLGTSAARLRVERPGTTPAATDARPRLLVGADLDWWYAGGELLIEWARLQGQGALDTENGIFGQLALPLRGSLFAVGRAEHYAGYYGAAVNHGTIGLVFRPRHATVKLEHHFGSTLVRSAPRGWYLSLSALY